MALNGCAECVKKPREIERLTEALQRLKQKLRDQERPGMEGVFGSSTPSATLPVKANTPPAKAPKRQGARPGHAGAGRQTFAAHEAERIIEVAAEVSDRCPSGDLPLEDNGTDGRLVLNSHPVPAERVLYRLPKTYGPQCRRTCPPRAPAVLPKSLSGNQRIATATTMHDLHGIPVGRICDQMGLGPGSLVEIVHRMARLLARIPARLIQEYRLAPVKHADATGWRTNGHHGDAWLFATPRLSLLLFCHTRAARVPQQVFGKPWLPGCLMVARDGGDTQVPGAIQYCDSHLLREGQDLDKAFPEAAEVKVFGSTVAPQLALAMGLRAQPLSDHAFARQAAALKAQLMTSMEEPAQHLGIRRIQEIFRAHVDRLYH